MATIGEDAGVAHNYCDVIRHFRQDVTVSLAIGGSATAGDDYVMSATQIVIPAGSTTGSITVTAVQDSLDEADETVVVQTSGVTGATEWELSR